MSYLSGNAWAIRAHERARQLQEGRPAQAISPVPGTIPLSLSGSSRTVSGLDYDQELALPMPKPRHLPPSDNELAAVSQASHNKSSVLIKPTKKRSTTDPSRAVAKTEGPKGDQEKKKSKIATLRSKLSLKDIGKDFRKDAAPVSSMPTVPKEFLTQATQRVKSPNAQGRVKETVMYVPTTQDPDVHPSSAPLFRSHPSPNLGPQNFAMATLTGPPHIDANKNGMPSDQPTTTICSVSFFEDSPVPGKTESMQHHVHTVLLEGPSPPAYTSAMSDMDHPQIVGNDQRMNCMTALSRPITPLLPPPAVAPAAATPCLPSVPVPTAQTKNVQDKGWKYPLIVSSDQKSTIASSRLPYGPQPAQHTCIPSTAMYEPMALPHGTQDNMQYSIPAPATYDAHLTGATSQGGYAPPPPHPGYQNTMSLEQYIATHVDSIHLHLDDVVNRLGRAVEDNNNWSSDQVMRNLNKLQCALADVRLQLGTIQRETLHLEARILAIFHTEMCKVRADIEALTCRIGTTHNAKPLNNPPGSRDMDRKGGYRKKWVNKNGERMGVGKERTTEHHSEEDLTREPVASNETTNKLNVTGQPPTAHEATSAVATQNDTPSQPQPVRTILKNPARISSGSPEPKATNLKTAAPSVAAENDPGTTTKVTGADNKSGHEDAKTPQRKGMLRGRFLQPPRRYRQGVPPNETTVETQKPSTPQPKQESQTPQILKDESPSAVHPALRSTTQQQIMAERERLTQQPGHHMTADHLFASSHRQGIRPQVSFPTLPSQRPMNMNMPVTIGPANSYSSRPYGATRPAHGQSPAQTKSSPTHDMVAPASNTIQLPRFGAVSEGNSANTTTYTAPGSPQASCTSEHVPPMSCCNAPSTTVQHRSHHQELPKDA